MLRQINLINYKAIIIDLLENAKKIDFSFYALFSFGNC